MSSEEDSASQKQRRSGFNPSPGLRKKTFFPFPPPVLTPPNDATSVGRVFWQTFSPLPLPLLAPASKQPFLPPLPSTLLGFQGYTPPFLPSSFVFFCPQNGFLPSREGEGERRTDTDVRAGKRTFFLGKRRGLSPFSRLSLPFKKATRIHHTFALKSLQWLLFLMRQIGYRARQDF